MGQNPLLYYKKSTLLLPVSNFLVQKMSTSVGVMFILWNIFLYLRNSEKEEKHSIVFLMPLLLNFI